MECKKLLREILMELRNGWSICTRDDEFPEYLRFEKGVWTYTECNTYNSETNIICREEALQIIKDHIKGIISDNEANKEEIRFLDELINSLVD